MADEKKEKIAPTDEYNELRYRELKEEVESEYQKMLEAKNEFGKAYKNFHQYLKSCASLVKEMLEEVSKTKGI